MRPNPKISGNSSNHTHHDRDSSCDVHLCGLQSQHERAQSCDVFACGSACRLQDQKTECESESGDSGKTGLIQEKSTWSRHESERVAEQLMAKGEPPTAEALGVLIRGSIQHVGPKTRKIDREVAQKGSGAVTLGAWRHADKVGVAKDTLNRPALVRVINQYMRSCHADKSWNALRVSVDCVSSPHKDARNAKGSQNHLVVLEEGKGGRLWIEGSDEGSEGSEAGVMQHKGCDVHGHFYPRSKPISFDPNASTLWNPVRDRGLRSQHTPLIAMKV